MKSKGRAYYKFVIFLCFHQGHSIYLWTIAIDQMLSAKIKIILSFPIFLLLLFSATFAKDFYLCNRVVDGDTIIVNMKGKDERVRLIGVDTPETKHPKKPVEYFGKEASAFTKEMVEGKRVRLEYDQEKRDRYGRLLAYVYLEGGTFLNAEIVKQGYGFAYTRFPFKYLDDFRLYEMEARDNDMGLWKNTKKSLIE